MKRVTNMLKTGFTLIEIMLALMVITIGVVSIAGLLSSSLGTSTKAHDDIVVVTFADLVLNTCHAEGYRAFNAEGGLDLIQMDGTSESLATGSMASYTGTFPALGIDQTQEYSVSYRITIQEQTDVKSIFLEVWPDRNTTVEPRRFYTEIYNRAKTE